MKVATLGIWLDRQRASEQQSAGINVFASYIGEMLAHRGIPFQWLEQLAEESLAACDLVIAAQEGSDDQAEALWAYAERGGTVIALANLDSWADRLHYRVGAEMEVAYAALPPELEVQAPRAEAAVPAGLPLRCFGARPWLPAGQRAPEGQPPQAEALGRLTESCALGGQGNAAPASAAAVLLKLAVGQGRLLRWAAPIPATVVRLQQGTGPVLADGCDAPDGTAAIADGILKADDGFALDWEADRRVTATGMAYFATAYADRWREALAAQLVQAAAEAGVSLPFKSYWPSGIEAVATVSFDSDFNQDEQAEATLGLLGELGIQTTWCMIEPGYSAPMYDKVRQGGHELAFHYNALEQQQGIWSEAEFGRQLDWLRQAIQEPAVVSNKNHYTRFQGWGELFAWCERQGILVDQSRGPSKKGNIGFLFGTCHPYFPVAWADEANRPYNVLEIGFLTQDLNLSFLADDSVITPFLDEAARVQGVAHFLFHQVHIYTHPEVRTALRKLAAAAEERGMPFWTTERISKWERARRQAWVAAHPQTGELQAMDAVGLEQPLEIWLPLPLGQPAPAAAEVALHYGVLCRKLTVAPAYSLQ